MTKEICRQCKDCSMMTFRGCADDVENDDLENGVCDDFFSKGTMSNPLPMDMTPEEEDIYM